MIHCRAEQNNSSAGEIVENTLEIRIGTALIYRLIFPFGLGKRKVALSLHDLLKVVSTVTTGTQ